MDKMIKGKRICLNPATQADKRKIFEWLTQSNLSKEMMGPPNYPDAKIPSWEEFDQDYEEHYFDHSAPLKGRCFIIIEQGNEVGQVNYNAINSEKKTTSVKSTKK